MIAIALTIMYNGATIYSAAAGTVALKTSGAYMEDDVIVVDSGEGGTDTSDANLTSGGQMLSGITAYAKGIKYTGTIQNKTASDMTVSGAEVTAPAGYYSSSAIKSVTTGTAGVPIATKGAVTSNSVKVTTIVTNTTGYITGGTKTGTAVTVSASELVSGTSNITTNGTYNITNYKSVSVDVSGGGGAGWETAPESWATGLIDGTISGSVYGSMTNMIGANTFMNCVKIINASFPECSTIGSNAFFSCYSLSSINFPKCTIIGYSAFGFCYDLKNASFPNCVKVASSAFYCCSALTNVNLPTCKQIETGAFYQCFSLSTVSIPLVSIIGMSTFMRCSYLSTLSIPMCRTILSSAFSNCHRLVSLYLTGPHLVYLIASNAFSSSPIGGYTTVAGKYGSIYVPSSMLSKYKTHSVWSWFAARFVGV